MTHNWSEAALQRELHALEPVDEAAVSARASAAGTRVADGRTRSELLDQVLQLTDLTSLESTDTPESIAALCATAQRPDPEDSDGPAVAAVCVQPEMVSTAAAELRGTAILVAGVAGAFPSGVAPVQQKVDEATAVVAAGADEVDLTIDRGAFLAGRLSHVVEEVAAVRAACPTARLKVILETGELGGLDAVQRAAWLVMLGGADMVKTSTGKGGIPGATPEVAAVLLDATTEFGKRHARRPGVKVSGGIRTPADALGYLRLALHGASDETLTLDQFRFGASSLVSAVVQARREGVTPGAR